MDACFLEGDPFLLGIPQIPRVIKGFSLYLCDWSRADQYNLVWPSARAFLHGKFLGFFSPHSFLTNYFEGPLTAGFEKRPTYKFCKFI